MPNSEDASQHLPENSSNTKNGMHCALPNGDIIFPSTFDENEDNENSIRRTPETLLAKSDLSPSARHLKNEYDMLNRMLSSKKNVLQYWDDLKNFQFNEQMLLSAYNHLNEDLKNSQIVRKTSSKHFDVDISPRSPWMLAFAFIPLIVFTLSFLLSGKFTSLNVNIHYVNLSDQCPLLSPYLLQVTTSDSEFAELYQISVPIEKWKNTFCAAGSTAKIVFEPFELSADVILSNKIANSSLKFNDYIDLLQIKAPYTACQYIPLCSRIVCQFSYLESLELAATTLLNTQNLFSDFHDKVNLNNIVTEELLLKGSFTDEVEIANSGLYFFRCDIWKPQKSVRRIDRESGVNLSRALDISLPVVLVPPPIQESFCLPDASNHYIRDTSLYSNAMHYSCVCSIPSLNNSTICPSPLFKCFAGFTTGTFSSKQNDTSSRINCTVNNRIERAQAIPQQILLDDVGSDLSLFLDLRSFLLSCGGNATLNWTNVSFQCQNYDSQIPIQINHYNNATMPKDL